MKKLMTIAAVAATALAACAAPLNPKTATEAECRAVLAELLASTNGPYEVGRAVVATRLHQTVANRRAFSGLRTEADDALAAKGVVCWPLWPYRKSFPKLSAIARAKNGAEAAYPKSLAIAERLGTNISCRSILNGGGTLDDVAVFISEAAAFPAHCYLKTAQFDDIKKTVQSEGIKTTKQWLRSQGKSFVSKDGVNPCEAYMTALNTALNAPRFAGLDAWLKGVGLKGIDLSALPTEAEVAKLRADVISGAVDLNKRNKAILYVCLGVEGYNQFVREYNGE